jgi:hypothetical protein
VEPRSKIILSKIIIGNECERGIVMRYDRREEKERKEY